MAEDTQEPRAEPQDGVFGNLPASRPGSRSPRRDGGRARDERAKPGPKPVAAEPAAAAAPEPPPPPPPPGAGPPATGGQRGGGIEDLAWAGVAVAAQAATVGVRLASRALDALRRPNERQ